MSGDDHTQDPDREPDYEVGYGRPPKHSQFKPNNKLGRGRRRGSRNMKTYVREALEAKVAVKINGKTQKITKIELSFHQLANKASSGNLKAIDKVAELYERHCLPEDEGVIRVEDLGYDLETIRHYFLMNGEDNEEAE